MLVLVVALLIPFVFCFQNSDLVDVQMQVVHADRKTPWFELPLDQMPRFRKISSSILRFSLPDNRLKIDPTADVKLYVFFCCLLRLFMIYVLLLVRYRSLDIKLRYRG